MSPRRPPPLPLLPILSALLAPACGTIEKDQRALGLQAATAAYQSAIRWGYYETALGYVHPDLRKGKTTVPPELKGVRLTGYDVVQPPLMQSTSRATQIVDIEYLHDDRQVIKHLTDHQTWAWDNKLDSWWLQSGLPKFE
jgi:hypothetical protein